MLRRSGRGRGGNVLGALLCAVLCAGLVAGAAILNPAGRFASPSLLGGEQALLCPSPTFRSALVLAWDPADAPLRAFLSVGGVPRTASGGRVISQADFTSPALFSGDSDVHTFHLAPGSALRWNVTAVNAWFYDADFLLFKGAAEYAKFAAKSPFSALVHTTGRGVLAGSLTNVTEYDEYVAVVVAREAITFREQFVAERVRYDAAALPLACNATGCSVPLAGAPAVCVLLDLDAAFGPTSAVAVAADSRTGARFWAVAGCAVGAAALAAVAFCVAIAVSVCRSRRVLSEAAYRPL